VPVQVRP